jgi:hypothetical protein
LGFWTVVGDEFNLLNTNANWVDCMRQWFVIVSTGLITWYMIFGIR